MKSNRASEKRLDSGGPINLRGIHYQLLSSFCEIGHAINVTNHEGEVADLSSVTLVIEPTGGGDSAILQGGTRRVQQIKTSASEWNLSRLVSGPFRDLFRAAADPAVASVELLTDGRPGAQIEGLCDLLKDIALGRISSESEAFETIHLPWYRKSTPSGEAATLSDFVEYLACELAFGTDSGPVDCVQYREPILRFLGRLSLKFQVRFEDQADACRQLLHSYGISKGAIASKIDQVVGYLIGRCKQGNLAITFQELAIELGLATHDLRAWSFLCGLGRDLLLADLSRPRLGYVAARDIRRSDKLSRILADNLTATGLTQPAASLGPRLDSFATFRPIVVWGRTGIGKTWLLARAASHQAQMPSATQLVWLWSEQDPQIDLEAACRKFCHQIWGREQALSLKSLADLVRYHQPDKVNPWLVVFVDGIKSSAYLDKLSGLQHGDLGVLLVVTITAELDEALAETRGFHLFKAPGFDDDEVLRFLQQNFPLTKGIPPGDVRKLLQIPGFCALYSAIKGIGSAWQPDDEYQLVNRFWLDRAAWPQPQAADGLAMLACSRMKAVVNGNEEPPGVGQAWTIAELKEAGLSQAELDDLENKGTLTRDGWSRTYSFALDRLFQWAAAEGALRAFQALKLTTEELVVFCLKILAGKGQARRSFAYVPADLIWLLLDPNLGGKFGSAAEAILAGLDGHRDFRTFESWLAGLGRRVVPALFRRLRDVGSTFQRSTYRKALDRIESNEVAQLATQMLDEPSLALQEACVELLGKREYPPALDALWALYQDWWDTAHAERELTSEPKKGASFFHIGLAERALRRSVRSQPDWLEQRLLESDLAGPRSTLLFLLAVTPKGEDVWRRHKDVLRSRLDDLFQRGFIRCIISFRDAEEIPWLKTKVNYSKDLVAPQARSALTLLEPDSAYIPVDPAAGLEDLIFGRVWWLAPAWAARPEETARFFRDLVANSKDPTGTAWDFSGFELWWPTEVIGLFLEKVRAVLKDFRSGNVEPDSDPLFAVLSRLSVCRRLDQLEFLWRPQNSSIDFELAEWLIGKGPNNHRREHLSYREAVEVLGMLASEGMSQAGAHILNRAHTWTEGETGLNLCVREPGPEEVLAIRRRALQPLSSSGPPLPTDLILQRLCTVALAYLGDLEGFAQGVLNWGLHLPSDLCDYLDDRRQTPALLEMAKKGLQEQPLRPGAILLLGLHGGEEALLVLREQVPQLLGADSDLELAWILALDASGDCTPDVMTAFAGRLNSKEKRISFCSWHGLLNRINDPWAQAALLSMFDNEDGDSRRLVGDLLENEILRRSAAERLWPRRNQPFFLSSFGSQLAHFAELQTAEVQAYLLDHANVTDVRYPKARISAIRGLSKFDRAAALRAALALRKDGKDPEGQWPELLMEIDALDAEGYLKEELSEARDIIRLHSVGEALRSHHRESSLQEWLKDSDPKVREGACYAACAQAFDERLESAVVRCCSDLVEDVRTAGQAAVEYLRRDREVGKIIGQLRAETKAGRRWALIDSALKIGYPGVRAGFGQVCWFSELVRDRPYYEREYCWDQLRKRREKFIKDIQASSQEFRRDL